MIARATLSIVIAGLTEPALAQSRLENAERDQVISIEDDSPEMADAVRKARASLRAFFELAANPHGTMRTFAVKVGVSTPRGIEYIWITDFRRDNGRVVGRIDNIPRWTTKIREGETFAFDENEIIDWLYLDGDRMRGNFTSCAINKMSSPAQAKAMQERFRMTCEE